MNIKTLLTTALLMGALANMAQAAPHHANDNDGNGTPQQTDSPAQFAANINRFNRLFPQEKAYLHFDNTASR